MAFIKEETEDLSISEQFKVKNEDAEDHTAITLLIFWSSTIQLHRWSTLSTVFKRHMYCKCDKLGSVDDTSSLFSTKQTDAVTPHNLIICREKLPLTQSHQNTHNDGHIDITEDCKEISLELHYFAFMNNYGIHVQMSINI